MNLLIQSSSRNIFYDEIDSNDDVNRTTHLEIWKIDRFTFFTTMRDAMVKHWVTKSVGDGWLKDNV